MPVQRLCINKNMPPIAGALRWSQELRERVSGGMEKLKMICHKWVVAKEGGRKMEGRDRRTEKEKEREREGRERESTEKRERKIRKREGKKGEKERLI